MNRREFIALVGGATAWPITARGQQPAIPVVGFLSTGSSAAFAELSEAFQKGLSESGYVDGRNVAIEYRWAEGRYDLLPKMAADLVVRKVAVIASTGGPPAVEAAAAATSTVPIVFLSGDDVLKKGIIASLNHPGGNITGVAMSFTDLTTKCLEFIKELLPRKTVFAMLVNPTDSQTSLVIPEIKAAATKLNIGVEIATAESEQEINQALTKMVEQRVDGVVVEGDAFFTAKRQQIIQLSARLSLPAIYMWSEFPSAGGLMSYGNSLAEGYHQVGGYTGRILNGDKPSDLPVMQPTKFELVINLKTARALGLAVPQSLLVAADEVIE
jgi:putative tryptophan/tyrosine transport system substrate-binding protein